MSLPVRRLSQRRSGVSEPPPRPGPAGLAMRLLDPAQTSLAVWAWRLVLFGIGYVGCGFLITFGAGLEPGFGWQVSGSEVGMDQTGAVAVGAVLAYVMVGGWMALEAWVVVPAWYGGEHAVGMPMVHWMTWGVILEAVYHFINPEHQVDCRVTEFKDNVGEPHVEAASKPDGEFWLDFVADVGDGFNPTYAVFSAMARSHIDLFGMRLPRADAVVVGGDLAYPMPRHEDVMSRFVRPLSWAFPEQPNKDDAPPRMYIMPGNHEWFDGLANYRHLILDREKIGAWTVKNKTPYFAVQLPHHWWMFCVDPGSEHEQDMDEAQVAYFTRIVQERTTPEDRFIFVVHEPDWIKNSGHGYALFRNMALFRHNVLGSRLLLSLAGDLHYYRRMEASEFGATHPTKPAAVRSVEAQFNSYVTTKHQLVVAGHGGAFAHPTFVPDISQATLGEPHIADGPVCRVVTDWPSPQESAATYDRLWLRGFSWGKNAGYGYMIGLLYMGFMLAVNPWDYTPAEVGLGNATTYAWPSAQDVWPNSVYLLRMVASFWFWPPALWMIIEKIIVSTTSLALRTWSQRGLALGVAVAHFGVHFLFAFLCRKVADAAWAQAIFAGGATEITFWDTVLFCFLSDVSMFLLGYFVGSYLTAVVFYVELRVLRSHYNEPMCTIEWQDNKGFLRMRITSEGDLDLYSIGIVRTPREWRQRDPDEYTDVHVGMFVPSDVPLSCCLVEKVLIRRRREEEQQALSKA